MPGTEASGTHTLLSGWGNTPRSAADVYVVDRERGAGPAMATAASATVLARGLGRSYGDASLNAGGAVLDMTGLTGVHGIDLAAGTITADAGLSLDALLTILLPLGFFLPVVPGTRYVTLGGAIAADIHGKNHHADGSLQDHLLAFDLLLPSGEMLAVTRESDPEVFAATCGGLGLTGVVTRATLRLLPVETAYIRVDRERMPNIEALMARFLDSDDRYRYSVAWIDCLARGRSLGRGVLLRGNHALAGELPRSKQGSPLAARAGLHARWPAWLPGGVLRRSTVTAFNAAAFRGSALLDAHGVESALSYFFPLDRIGEWNRMYGGRGFVQHQFVVPYGAEAALLRAVELLANQRCPSFLAVLKRLGPGHDMLSFPREGWTLALDIPAAVTDLAELLDELDRIVVEAGGRIYLAKDARLQADLLPAMYPELERWRAVRRRLDPENRLRSDLARRLNLL